MYERGFGVLFELEQFDRRVWWCEAALLKRFGVEGHLGDMFFRKALF